MVTRTGEPHSAAEVSARSGRRGQDEQLDGSLPPGGEDGIEVFHDFETLVDAQLEKLVHRAAANLGREPDRFDEVDDVDGVRW